MASSVVLILCFLFIIPFADCFQCHSCFAGCSSLSHCDCKNQTCDGSYCFAKIELFPEDDVSSILKGCVDYVPTDFVGCQHAGDNHSVECYCTGDFCNSVENLMNYEPKTLPEVQCCHCVTGDKKCQTDSCRQTCRGHYCYSDMDANSRGCGSGYPQLYNELRTKNLSQFLINPTCVKSTAGDPRISSWIRGCACASDFCNRYTENTSSLDSDISQTEQTSFVNCHSFADSSEKTITVAAYRKTGICQGHFCYLTLTTHQVVFESDDNINRERYDEDEDDSEYEEQQPLKLTTMKVTPYFHEKYDFIVGCLIVDDVRKVDLGCTTEYGENQSRILTRHCTCKGDYCNFYNLMTGESGTAATLVPKRLPVKGFTTKFIAETEASVRQPNSFPYTNDGAVSISKITAHLLAFIFITSFTVFYVCV